MILINNTHLIDLNTNQSIKTFLLWFRITLYPVRNQPMNKQDCISQCRMQLTSTLVDRNKILHEGCSCVEIMNGIEILGGVTHSSETPCTKTVPGGVCISGGVSASMGDILFSMHWGMTPPMNRILLTDHFL